LVLFFLREKILISQKKKSDETSLQKLSANNVPGYEKPYAKDFAKDGDTTSLGLMQYIQKIEEGINTKGRVPGIKPEYIGQGWGRYAVVDAAPMDVFGSKAYFERCSGKVRGNTRFIYADEKGPVFRTDCFAIPEMWLEAHLTWEELVEVMKERPV